MLTRLNLLASDGEFTDGENETPTLDATGEVSSAFQTTPTELTRDEPAHLANHFLPTEPTSFRDAGLTESEVEALALKYLHARGNVTGRNIAEQIRLPFALVDEMMADMKDAQLVVHRKDAPMNDYEYQLSEMGRERARRLAMSCTYFGSAPVSLEDYINGIEAQSIDKQNPTPEDLHNAFDDLILNKRILDRLGPSINSGRGMFLYGPPGNGKTSIAERMTRAFGQYIWIPRSLTIQGEIVRLYDPACHEEVPLPNNVDIYDTRRIDQRWIRVRRPTIVAGGELTMSSLEVTTNHTTGISEAPLQLKSNCGVLLIDDFGRQRMSIAELLNRWIVPLEKRHDYLNLANGKKICVPFDQLIVFSTNLEPRELVDEAFLRRIPYKIEVHDPSNEEFHKLFEVMGQRLGFIYDSKVIDNLIEKHYRKVDRALRFCHPRDLLLQIRNHCTYYGEEMLMTDELFDRAIENYFAVM
jgi:predicted ATPase with chaperone activity